MSKTHVVVKSVATGGDTIEIREELSSGNNNSIDEVLLGSTPDQLVALVIDVTQLKSFIIKASKACELNFNDDSGGTPDFTFTLAAGGGIAWDINSGHANPFGTTDITALYVTVAGAATCRLQGEFLLDPTV